ncbi:MAG: class I tRNA ligase family protein, partial [Hyphomicrobiaceae bacterium]|nr:class I tRNA ligase family protein [Hyphomicrobiaceae bacterium]
MLSDSPPDRDVIWTEEGVAGAHRFVQRVWRLVSDSAPAPADAGREPSPGDPDEAAAALRKVAHKALADVGEHIKALRFNVAVARIYELANAIAAASPKAGESSALAHARREAVELLVQMMAPMMPHLAEECWHALGHEGLVSMTPWPKFEASLLAEDVITYPVQVNGKKRAELTIAIDASQADVEVATLALDAVRRALGGNSPKKIVVVPKRIVNVVV